MPEETVSENIVMTLVYLHPQVFWIGVVPGVLSGRLAFCPALIRASRGPKRV